MDEIGSNVPTRLLVKIPKEKLKVFEGLWSKKQQKTKSYQRSKSEDAAKQMMKATDAGEEETSGKILTHFKKRIIRTHSATVTTMPPTDFIQEYPRMGRHHLPATTPTRPMALPYRQRLSQDVPPALPKSPEVIQKDTSITQQNEKSPKSPEVIQNDINKTQQNEKLPKSPDINETQQEEVSKEIDVSTEHDFSKVLNNFYAIMDTVRGTIHHDKDVVKAGIAEMESFLSMCDSFAKRNFVVDEHRIFYSLLECMRGFTTRIRKTMHEGVRTTSIMQPLEANFYKNVFFRMFHYLTTNSANRELISAIKLGFIWNDRDETGNVIVFPLLRHAACYHSPKKEEIAITSKSENLATEKFTDPSPNVAEQPKEVLKEVSPAPSQKMDTTDADDNEKNEENKEEVQKQIKKMQKNKKPKYKVSEILYIEIDSECDSSDEQEMVTNDKQPVKSEPEEEKDNQTNVSERSESPATPPKTPETQTSTSEEDPETDINEENSESTLSIVENTDIDEDQPLNISENRPDSQISSRDSMITDELDMNLQQPKRIRVESSTNGGTVIQHPPVHNVPTPEDLLATVRENIVMQEDSFRQQFPNTVISRKDGDIISDGRVVVLEKGRVAEEPRLRRPPPYTMSSPPVPHSIFKPYTSPPSIPPPLPPRVPLPPQVPPSQPPRVSPPLPPLLPLNIPTSLPSQISPSLPSLPPLVLPSLPPPYPTNGVSQTVRNLENLSDKEALDPIEYVKEIEALCKIPNIPEEFKHFYGYITKVQILHKHNPIAFRLFLELLNQGGLREYHTKFREYAARKVDPPPPRYDMRKRVYSKR